MCVCLTLLPAELDDIKELQALPWCQPQRLCPGFYRPLRDLESRMIKTQVFSTPDFSPVQSCPLVFQPSFEHKAQGQYCKKKSHRVKISLGRAPRSMPRYLKAFTSISHTHEGAMRSKQTPDRSVFPMGEGYR